MVAAWRRLRPALHGRGREPLWGVVMIRFLNAEEGLQRL